MDATCVSPPLQEKNRRQTETVLAGEGKEMPGYILPTRWREGRGFNRNSKMNGLYVRLLHVPTLDSLTYVFQRSISAFVRSATFPATAQRQGA